MVPVYVSDFSLSGHPFSIQGALLLMRDKSSCTMRPRAGAGVEDTGYLLKLVHDGVSGHGGEEVHLRIDFFCAFWRVLLSVMANDL
jgi:hypothetical protein